MDGRARTPRTQGAARGGPRRGHDRWRLGEGGLLIAFTDEDIAAWAAGLPRDRRAAVRAALPPGPNRVRTALLEPLKRELEDAIGAGNWTAAAELLGELSDAEIATRVAALDPAQRRLLMAAAREHGSSLLYDRIAGAARSGPGETPAPGQVFGLTTITQTFQDGGSPHGVYASQVAITFEPNPAVCQCDDIGFVQTVRMVDTGTNHNRDNIGKQGERLNEHQQAVDRFPGHSSGYYGRTNADTAGSNVTPGRCPPPSPARMTVHDP